MTQELTTIDELKAELATLLETAESLTIASPSQYAASAELTKAARAAGKRASDGLAADLVPVVTQEKEIRDRWRPLQQQAARIKDLVDHALLAYRREAERIAQEAQAKLLEQQRRDAERLQKRAEVAREKGHEEKAEALRVQAETQPVAIVAPAIPKVAGLTTRKVWTFEIVNTALIPREYLIPNEKAIAAVVKALKERTNIPGIIVYETENMSGARQ